MSTGLSTTGGRAKRAVLELSSTLLTSQYFPIVRCSGLSDVTTIFLAAFATVPDASAVAVRKASRSACRNRCELDNQRAALKAEAASTINPPALPSNSNPNHRCAAIPITPLIRDITR